MAISNEIEKLEKRWQQTSGLVFAPLAEAYRKAGLHARALEILEQGLALHADYGPALIVRGRCHLDTGTLPEAEQAFHAALARDPMDPIALRGIADVYERTGRLHEAVERLQLVVDLDPRNAEARQVLERLLATPAIPVAVDMPASAPESAPAVAEEPSSSVLDELSFEVVNLSAEDVAPAVPEVRAEPRADDDFRIENFAVEPVDAASWRAAEAHAASTLDEFVPTALPADAAPDTAVEPPAEVPEEPPYEAAAPLPAPVLWTPAPEVEVATQLVGEPEPACGDAPVEEAVDAVTEEVVPAEVVVESVVVEAAAAEEAAPVPAIAPELVTEVPTPAPVESSFDAAPAMDVPAAVSAFEQVESVAAEVPDEAPAEGSPVAEPMPGEYASVMEHITEPAEARVVEEPQAHEEQAELIVTESMAELFLKQGHRELALAVYRQLRERAPDSAALGEAIARLERELTPVPESAPAPREYAASRTGGRSVEALLQRVLEAEPPAAASRVLPPAYEPSAGEPARSLGEALPLSAVFGDEPQLPPKPDAAPAGGAPEPSYDEFFGAVGGEPAAAGGSPRGAEGEDLRQFNEWLKGLKR